MSIPSYIDMHCDTAYEMYCRGQSILQNDLAVSLQNAQIYPHYAQFFAVWSDQRLDDDAAYENFLHISDFFFSCLESPDVAGKIALLRTGADLDALWSQSKCAAIPAVEDARLLHGDLTRLDELRRRGVRVLTLLWGGNTCIGGSHDTPDGLTDFGIRVVKRCFEIGIVPDISHASEQSAEQILALAAQARTPVLATHSNAYGVYPHTRNLRDRHFTMLRKLDGLVGINLCTHHLCDTTSHPATVEDVFRHMEYYLSLGGEQHLVIGADWDGAPTPDGIRTAADLPLLAECMARHNYSQQLIENIFFSNARRFIKKYL